MTHTSSSFSDVIILVLKDLERLPILFRIKFKLPTWAYKQFLNWPQTLSHFPLSSPHLLCPWSVQRCVLSFSLHTCYPGSFLKPQVNTGSLASFRSQHTHLREKPPVVTPSQITAHWVNVPWICNLRAMLSCSQPTTGSGGTWGLTHPWETGDFTIRWLWLQDTPTALPNVPHSACQLGTLLPLLLPLLPHSQTDLHHSLVALPASPGLFFIFHWKQFPKQKPCIWILVWWYLGPWSTSSATPHPVLLSS